MEGTCCGWGLFLMSVFLSSEGGQKEGLKSDSTLGVICSRSNWDVDLQGTWTCHSPTQRGQMTEKGHLCGCRKLLQQPGLPDCAWPPPLALLLRGAKCSNCSSGFASLSSAYCSKMPACSQASTASLHTVYIWFGSCLETLFAVHVKTDSTLMGAVTLSILSFFLNKLIMSS